MFNIGAGELILILLIILLLFGAKRLPEIGRSIGKALGEFKKGLKETKEEIEKDEDTEKKSK
ncbi:MAG TPA: twin-arginine translocase TatA/TatE family subunit [Candidatus Ratteibacteria bacterium]|nr:twin-arginine translocase TatA/TatE family subunit [bacterium]HRR96667.1 twin-arginine translocase TatA/TatE family subunit [Candidatus Ratteibacteria bacterium]